MAAGWLHIQKFCMQKSCMGTRWLPRQNVENDHLDRSPACVQDDFQCRSPACIDRPLNIFHRRWPKQILTFDNSLYWWPANMKVDDVRKKFAEFTDRNTHETQTFFNHTDGLKMVLGQPHDQHYSGALRPSRLIPARIPSAFGHGIPVYPQP